MLITHVYLLEHGAAVSPICGWCALRALSLSAPSFSRCGKCSVEKTKTDKSVFDEQVGALSGNYQLHENCNSRDHKLFVNPPNGVRQTAFNAVDTGEFRVHLETRGGDIGLAEDTDQTRKIRLAYGIHANRHSKIDRQICGFLRAQAAYFLKIIATTVLLAGLKWAQLCCESS